MSKVSEALENLYKRRKTFTPEWLSETRATLLKSFPCPDDTNGDGDCGKPACPHCGTVNVTKSPLPTDAHRERVRKHETAWLIEIPGTHPLWYMGQTKEGPYKGKHAWTYTATNATRYSSKKEAELACADLRLGELFGDVIVTEHGFDSETPSPPPPQPERHRVTCGNCGTTTWSNEGHSPCNPKEWSAWPKPEVVVAERDRELANHLVCAFVDMDGDDVVSYEIAKRVSTHMATERAEHERVKEQLSNEKNTVQHKHDAWQDEKKRRIYYQDIVYAVCNHLDRIFGGKTCCGTVDEPSTEVQALMGSLHKGNRVLELETKLAEKAAQLAATEAKLREAEGRVVEIEASGERGEVFVDDENRQHLRDAANGHVPAIECDRCDLPFFVASTTESIRRIKCCPRCGCKQLTVTETVYLREDNPHTTSAE